jgi:hypothetical protein
VEAGALEALEAGAARIRAALGASAVSTDGLRAAFLSPDEWLPGASLREAAALAGLSLPAGAATSRSEEPKYTAASIDGQQDVSELAAALALTQQASATCSALAPALTRPAAAACAAARGDELL